MMSLKKYDYDDITTILTSEELQELIEFGEKLEKACNDTLMSGIMTKDLVSLTDGSVEVKAVYTTDFIKAIRQNLEKAL